jgi:hypothetical protein
MDPAEDGLGGVVVELFLQGTSTLKRSVTTTGGGAFVMAGLTAGSYEVRQTPVAGHMLAVPARVVTMAANGAAVANFANQPAGVVSGRVFNDVNGNRVQDREEVGIGGVRVTLTDLATSAALSVVTSTDGAYVFGNTGRGDYRVTETDPKGFLSTTPNAFEFSLAVGGSRVANFADSTDRYASWAAGHGLLAGQSGTGDDPDRDGLANLVEFALGLDPKKASATTQAQARMVQINGSRYPALEFVRSKDAVGAEFELATSTDLLNWTVVPAAIEAQQDLGPDTERVRLRGTSPLGPQKAQFYLLRVKRAGQ